MSTKKERETVFDLTDEQKKNIESVDREVRVNRTFENIGPFIVAAVSCSMALRALIEHCDKNGVEIPTQILDKNRTIEKLIKYAVASGAIFLTALGLDKDMEIKKLFTHLMLVEHLTKQTNNKEEK